MYFKYIVVISYFQHNLYVKDLEIPKLNARLVKKNVFYIIAIAWVTIYRFQGAFVSSLGVVNKNKEKKMLDFRFTTLDIFQIGEKCREKVTYRTLIFLSI